MLKQKNIKILFIKFFVALLIAITLVVSITNYVKAEAPQSVVDGSWKFWALDEESKPYSADNNTFKKIGTIVALNGNQLATFKISNDSPDYINTYRQEDPVYREGFCRSYIYYNNRTQSLSIAYPVNKDEGGTFGGNSYCDPRSEQNISSWINTGSSNGNKPANIAVYGINLSTATPPQEVIDALKKSNQEQNADVDQRPEDANTAETTEERVGCEDLGGPFGWIICWVGDLGDQIIDLFDKGLYMLLDVPTANWEKNGVKTAWETFRNISSTLIVLVALVGIASQIFNFDFISAYTIRKILPKLFIAIILIQLSWFLGTIMIQISNTVGYSIQSLIMAPFIAIAEQKLNTDITQFAFSDVMRLFLSDADTPGATSFIGVSIMSVAAGLAVSSAIGAGGVAVLFMIMSALLTAGIALLVAFTVIAFRYALILALLVVMPIAIVAWVLPSTKKWFDKWWDLFFALLAMFPIIIAVLSFGKAAAIIIALSAGSN